MKVRLPGHFRMLVYGVLAVLVLCGQPAHGGILTAELTCVLSGPSSVDCGAVSFGTVTLDDSVGGGHIGLTVDLRGIAGKFSYLMLNFDGAGIATTISSGDSQATRVANGFSLYPYFGQFDIGRRLISDISGWHSHNDPYTMVLSGNGALTLDMFDVMDSWGRLNVALYEQDFTHYVNCADALAVGGIWEQGGGGGQEVVPEPATFTLLGGGLIAFAWALRRRKAA